MNYGITLVCWHCGESKTGICNHPPQFAFELAQMANDVGMLGVLDMNRGRALVFCNEDCSSAEKTKSGHWRARPVGVKKP